MFKKSLDFIDFKLLNALADNPDASLKELGEKIIMFSPPSISRRKKNLFDMNIITETNISIDFEKLGYYYEVVILVKAKFGKNYIQTTGQILNSMRGVLAVYNISGDIDFLVFAIYKNRHEFLQTLDLLMNSETIERTDTRQVHRIFKNFNCKSVTEEMVEENRQKLNEKIH